MPENKPKRSLTALNWLNFFAADISTGVGPFLAVYLASNLHYKPGQIGIAIAATNFSMVLFQSPAGFYIDQTQFKKRAIIVASVIMGLTAVSIPFFHSFPFIIGSQIVMGMAGSFYVPTLIALATILTAKGKFDQTISKNQSFNHAGNVAAAVLIGVVAKFTHNEGIFYCLLLLSLLCTISALFISQQDLDKPAAGQPEPNANDKKSSVIDMLRNKAFVVFLLLTVIFYFSNGAMLPLVGQELARGKEQSSTLYLSACIIIAQVVMVPVAYISGKQAGKGRKKLLVIAFLLLAARGVLYTISDRATFLLSLQILDGMAAGIFSVVSIMVVADLMGNSGKASFAQGLLATSLSLGSTLSNLIAGFIVDAAGFKIGFMFLSVIAVGAMFLLWKAMPETLHKTNQQ